MPNRRRQVESLRPLLQQIRLEASTRASRSYSGLSGIFTGIGLTLIKEDPLHGSIALIIGLGVGLLGLSDAKYSGDLNKSIKESEVTVHPEATKLRFYKEDDTNLASKTRLPDQDSDELKK